LRKKISGLYLFNEKRQFMAGLFALVGIEVVLGTNMRILKMGFRLSSLRWLNSQVKSVIINKAFCIVQRATPLSKIGTVRGYGLAESPPTF
jgi:hypothetical protein